MRRYRIDYEGSVANARRSHFSQAQLFSSAFHLLRFPLLSQRPLAYVQSAHIHKTSLSSPLLPFFKQPPIPTYVVSTNYLLHDATSCPTLTIGSLQPFIVTLYKGLLYYNINIIYKAIRKYYVIYLLKGLQKFKDKEEKEDR